MMMVVVMRQISCHYCLISVPIHVVVYYYSQTALVDNIVIIYYA